MIKMRRLGNEIDKPLVLLDADDARQRVQSLGYKMKAESPRKIMHLNGLQSVSRNQSKSPSLNSSLNSNENLMKQPELKVAKIYRVKQDSNGELN